MIIEVKVPEVGESITEGVLAGWLKEDGELVQAGESLFELETDKVTMAVPADVPGKLSILVPEGETVEVGQVVAKIDTEASDQPGPSEPQVAPPPERAPAAPEPPPDVGTGPALSPPAGMPQAAAKLRALDGGGPHLSPAVRRLVAEHGVDPEQVPATGPGGRITKGDVLQHVQGQEAPAEPAAPAAPAAIVPVSPPAPAAVTPGAAPAQAQLVRTAEAEQVVERETRVKMTPLRHRIAERLVQAQQEAAILSTFNEVDMSSVMAFRARHKDKFEKKFDVRLGFMSFFVKAVVDALKTVPELNARIDGDEIVYQHYYDIGVAVSTEQGLIVPVIRGADRLGFAAIEQQIGDYAARARKRQLRLDELTGGVFTLSNGGIYGSLLSTPILNPPQSGILGMHQIKKRPVVVNDEIVVRPMMYLAVSYDHRLVDGAQAVTFLKRVVECIEDPERMLLEV
jgi:2-oxoglutarate dehydrogenase E2 component (dihydrolipoamide succinyltransferase)